MSATSDLRYTREHEWLRADGDLVTVGITDYAAAKLGDVVFVELPDEGAEVTAGSVIAEVESTKSVGEIFAPIDGTIESINEELHSTPELVNESPFDAGWLFTLRVASVDDLESGDLLDADGYAAYTAE